MLESKAMPEENSKKAVEIALKNSEKFAKNAVNPMKNSDNILKNKTKP